MEWMILPLKRYAQFNGRSRRMEYWMFLLFSIIVGIVTGVIDLMLGFGRTSSFAGPTGAGASFVSHGPINLITSLALFIPSLAVSVRRLHDTDRTGWWILVPIVLYGVGAMVLIGGLMSRTAGSIAGMGALAIVGGLAMFAGFIAAIVLLVFFCMPGTAGLNRFGPDPLDPSGAQDLEDVFR